MYKNIAEDALYVVCLWETILCVSGMYAVVLQHEISAPQVITRLLVSNIHDIILVHTQFVLVCTWYCTVTSQFKAVLYNSIEFTNATMCCTMYAQNLL
jgi:hypothetical protein